MIKKLAFALWIAGTACPLPAQSSYPDGAEPLMEPAAALGYDRGEAADFEPGAKLFTDRDYEAKDVPPILRGFRFIRGELAGVRAVCREAGVVYVVTKDDPQATDSLVEVLGEGGFEKTNLRAFLLFGGDLCSIYQKQVAADEMLDFGKWGVIVVPSTDVERLRQDPAAAAEPSLRGFAHPPVNFRPGPEYGPDKRNYQGVPTLERAPGGRLWAAWYAGKVWEDRFNYVVGATSGDDGKTWSDLRFVIDPDGDGPLRAADPCLWLDPGGKLWLFWWHNGPRESVTMAVTTENPDAETPVWSEPRPLFHGVMINKPTVTSKGEWFMPAAVWHRDGSSKIVVSADRGETWAVRGCADVPPDRRNCDEHMVVERADGSFLMLVRTANHGIGAATSSDEGRTWTQVADYSRQATTRFFLRRLRSGNLLLLRHGAMDEDVGRSKLMAFLSGDDGKTWDGGLVLDERGGVSYPDAAESPEGLIYSIHDWNRGKEKNILMSVFSEKDVLAGKPVGPDARFKVLINRATGVNPKVSGRAK